MTTTETNTSATNNARTPYPNIPPIMESLDSEYRNPGVTSTVQIAGHPIHPLIVTLPITMLLLVAGSDVGYLLTQDAFWARSSVWLLGLSLVTLVLAAITGMTDFVRIKRVRKRTAGWAHMYLNITILVLTIANFWLRQGNLESAIVPTGITISLLTSVLLGVSGWYGGELVYRHKVSVIGPSSREREL